MTCPECGLEIPDGDPACPICGFAVGGEAAARADAAFADIVRLPRPRLRWTPRPPAAPAEPTGPTGPAAPAAPAGPVGPTATAATAKRRKWRFAETVRAVGRGLAAIPSALDEALLWILRYQWNFLPSWWRSFERGGIRSFAAGGRFVGHWIGTALWETVRLAVLLILLAAKLVAAVLFLVVMIVVCVVMAAASA